MCWIFKALSFYCVFKFNMHVISYWPLQHPLQLPLGSTLHVYSLNTIFKESEKLALMLSLGSCMGLEANWGHFMPKK